MMLPLLKDDEESFYWEHSNGQLAFRATYKKLNRELVGFNFLGMRFSHPVAEEWIRTGKTVDLAINNLSDGGFDAEFSRLHYRDIQNAFRKNTDLKSSVTY